SLLNDSLEAANAQSDALLGTETEAPKFEPLKTEWDDAKSNLSDAVNSVRDAAKEIKDAGGKMTPGAAEGLLKAAGKIAFRALKAKVDAQIQALKDYIKELEANLSAEEKILAGLFRERMRMSERRNAATDARLAVTAARNALMACMART